MSVWPKFPRPFRAQKDETILRLTALVECQEAVIASLKIEAAKVGPLTAQVEMLTARVAELEAKLGQPPKTPDNSSVPPSRGQKPSNPSKAKPKATPHAGAHRPLHPNPTTFRDLRTTHCPGCGCDVSNVEQYACEAYDRIEIPEIAPDVTRVTLHGGVCPCCRKRFKAVPPADIAPGSPFGPNLRAFVIFLRTIQNISLNRLVVVLECMFGLRISEGAIVNILDASRESFRTQTSLIKARLLSGTALASDETGVRVGKANWWLWVFHNAMDAVFVADPHRTKEVVEGFLGGRRPDLWLSDRLGSQMGWAKIGHQVCLAHLIRDAQYVLDEGDIAFASGLIGLFKRACAIGRRRDRLAASTLKVYEADVERRLDRLLKMTPTTASGKKLMRAIKRFRQHLWVFMANGAVEPTNNGSERALRPAAVYRKVTNGFRAAWAATLYADTRSVVESGRRRGLSALEAIRLTLAGTPLPDPA
jgi:transposase